MGGRDTSRRYDNVVVVRGIHFGCDASRPYDNVVEIRGDEM
ncbi:MAG: hypothetical protein ACI30M_03885 [Muribaculaceae bacterium]